jgi:signal transduction histidine kinase
MSGGIGQFMHVHQPAVASRWLTKVRASRAHEEDGLTAVQTMNSMGIFLAELIKDLQASPVVPPARRRNDIAREHGRQRHGLGTGLRQLVHEYGLCFEATVEIAREQGDALSESSQIALAQFLFEAAADAVDEYTARELSRQRAATTATWSLQLEHVPLHALARDAIEHASFQAQQRGVRLEVDIDHELTIPGDRRLLLSVLSNLLMNGARFTKLGSVVTARARQAEGRLLLEVLDQCGGLHTKDIEEMFGALKETGAQPDRPTSEGSLALSQQAIEAHSGTLNIVNDEGVGCRFVIDLPLHVGVALQ